MTKYELNSAAFMPLCLLISIPVLPCLIGTMVLLLMEFKTSIFIAFLAVLVFYMLFILIAYISSKRPKDYLILGKDHLIIKSQSINDYNETKVLYHSIIRFEYYRMFSFQGWLNIFNGIAPHGVFIVYSNNVTELVGYLSPKHIDQISKFSGTHIKYM